MNEATIAQLSREADQFIRALALRGAQVKLDTIEQEREQIYKLFPQLREASEPAAPESRSALWTPERRKAHSRKLKAVWAQRKKARSR